MIIEVDADYQGLLSKLIEKRDEAPNKLAEVVNESAFEGQAIVIGNAPIKEGTLRGSHRVESRGLLERIIFPDQGVAPHALFVILGTKPHTIKGKPYLSWKGAKHPVKKVNHPGTKPNDYMKKSIPAIKTRIESNLQTFTDWLKQ